ncbi:hypothetical protein ANO11243_077860 [Dothideomycetidae sp. 11243]|nr:hypothetical protein ANO11243_077860 [fungal sp. No.11243]
MSVMSIASIIHPMSEADISASVTEISALVSVLGRSTSRNAPVAPNRAAIRADLTRAAYRLRDMGRPTQQLQTLVFLSQSMHEHVNMVLGKILNDPNHFVPPAGQLLLAMQRYLHGALQGQINDGIDRPMHLAASRGAFLSALDAQVEVFPQEALRLAARLGTALTFRFAARPVADPRLRPLAIRPFADVVGDLLADLAFGDVGNVDSVHQAFDVNKNTPAQTANLFAFAVAAHAWARFLVEAMVRADGTTVDQLYTIDFVNDIVGRVQDS